MYFCALDTVFAWIDIFFLLRTIYERLHKRLIVITINWWQITYIEYLHRIKPNISKFRVAFSVNVCITVYKNLSLCGQSGMGHFKLLHRIIINMAVKRGAQIIIRVSDSFLILGYSSLHVLFIV